MPETYLKDTALVDGERQACFLGQANLNFLINTLKKVAQLLFKLSCPCLAPPFLARACNRTPLMCPIFLVLPPCLCGDRKIGARIAFVSARESAEPCAWCSSKPHRHLAPVTSCTVENLLPVSISSQVVGLAWILSPPPFLSFFGNEQRAT